jgi:hypothetical protein
MGKPKMKAVLLNAEIIGKFKRMAVNTQIKANRNILILFFIIASPNLQINNQSFHAILYRILQ